MEFGLSKAEFVRHARGLGWEMSNADLRILYDYIVNEGYSVDSEYDMQGYIKRNPRFVCRVTSGDYSGGAISLAELLGSWAYREGTYYQNMLQDEDIYTQTVLNKQKKCMEVLEWALFQVTHTKANQEG